jgi:CRISPR-associated protein Csm3
MAWKLLGYIPITAKLILKSGTHVGMSKDNVGVGELDLPVIRHPHTREPYIPGSSIKGKMRSLSEYRLNLVSDQGREKGAPHGCETAGCLVCRLFGPHKKTEHSHGPTRLIVRDAMLSEESKALLQETKEQDIPFTETKTENTINRTTGASAGSGQGGVREQERVPAGVVFNFALSLRVFEGDKQEQICDFIKKSLDWLQKDTLGGSGTRGYGWIELQNLTIGKLES